MLKYVIPILAIMIFAPIFSYGQSLSELDKQLKEETEKRAQEIQESQQSQQGSFAKVDCPRGTHERAISGGGIICVDDATGKEVKPEDYLSYQLGGESATITVGIIIFIIIIIIAIKIRKKSKVESVVSEGRVRKPFSQDIRDMVLEKQSGRCAICGKHVSSFQFDHKDGDSSNNSLNNCQALCPNCHDRKSRGLN